MQTTSKKYKARRCSYLASRIITIATMIPDVEKKHEVNRASRHNELIREVVGWWKDNPHRSPLSHRIPKMFDKKKEEFWGEVVFYNYIQAFAGIEARVRPSDELWSDPRNPEAFQEVLDDYQPDRILVLGKKLWVNLPSKSPPIAATPEAEIRLPVSNDMIGYQEVDRTCYWYFCQSGHPALAMPVMHPAAVRFSTDKWIMPVADWLSFRA